MPKYAEHTDVSADKSRAEIDKTLQRYGATGFMYGWEESQAMIAFKMSNRQIKFLLKMPDRQEKRFWFTPGRNMKRTDAQAYQAWEQATRQRWRALALAVKAKLEAVESGITTFEQEFYAFVVLPSGRTIYEETCAAVNQAYLTGKTPLLLPATRS